jgi:tRNA (guanosine-2'-O-)-methyltransferase
MPTKAREERIRKVMESRQEGVVLVLEDVHDPHNIGAVMRSAEAFGVGEVWIIYEKEPYVNMRRVGKFSSSSANKWLTIKFFRSTKACMTALKRKKYTTVATVPHEKHSKNIFDTQFKGKRVAILLGNEHRGLSRYAIEKSDRLLVIPMRGFVESLNISVTAGILLFELTRQRMKSNKKTKV